MQTVRETMGVLQEGTDISDKDALNAVLVERGKAEKKIFEVENLAEAAGAFGKGLRGGN